MFVSFKPEKNVQTIEKSKGKGGSFFLSSFDQLFLIKTLTRDETDTFTKYLLSKYTKHMKRYPNSLLCPIYGLFSLEFSRGTHIYFIIMRNIIGPFRSTILRQYDLKGSTHNRRESLNIKTNLKDQTLKDLNFNDLEGKIFLGKRDTETVSNQLEEDSYMLSENDLMDYSMLLTVIRPDNLEQIKQTGVFNKVKNAYVRRTFLRRLDASD